MSKTLEASVHCVPTADSGASMERFRNGDVDLAWFGGLLWVQARFRVPGARSLLRILEAGPLVYTKNVAFDQAEGMARELELLH